MDYCINILHGILAVQKLERYIVWVGETRWRPHGSQTSAILKIWHRGSNFALVYAIVHENPQMDIRESWHNCPWQYFRSFDRGIIILSVFMAPDRVVIPHATKLRGGILDSPCSSVRLSVRLSVRPSVRPWVGVRMITLILFSGFKIFFLHISLGSRSCMGLNISVLPH